MLEKVKSFLKQGEIKEALRLLAAQHPDAAILMAQFQSGEKQFGLGILDFDSWERKKSAIVRMARQFLTEKFVAELESQTTPDFQARQTTVMGINERLLEALKAMVETYELEASAENKSLLNARAAISEAEQLFKQ